MKSLSLTILFAIAWCGRAEAQNPETDAREGSEALKRILPATAAPEGSLEVGVYTEFSTLNFDYSAFDEWDDEVDFVADKFHTFTTDLVLAAGLIEDVELEVLFPLVFARFEAAERDDFSRQRERTDFGVGDVEVEISYGWESEDETFFALFSLGAELPTNTLDEFFGGKTKAGVGAIEIEKYFGGFGLIGGIESKYEDKLWEHEYFAGVALIPNEKLYSQIFFARNTGEGINKIEAAVEYLFTEDFTMEWIFSHEISGPERETIAGVGFNVFFGESEEEDDEEED